MKEEAGDEGRARRPTSSSRFGVGRRESHDSSAFYSRFEPPQLSSDSTVEESGVLDEIFLGDARDMSAVATSSVALVVTSPPYFVGKEYETALGEGHIPGSYIEYLQLLEEVFAECVRVLEPGGRIAVNVANLGRRPYRSLSADVIAILQDRLHLLLRGEIIWQKGIGASGSCAWGSFQSPQNPVLRDITERIVVASKGRFDRAVNQRDRQRRSLPSEISIFKDEFMEATLDVWDIPPESATRVNHPAPFPVELPKRLIDLYTYRDDVVLDPFSGSGSTAVAAVRTGRHFLGFEIDDSYRDIALKRIAQERADLQRARAEERGHRVRLSVAEAEVASDGSFAAHAVKDGARAKEVAVELLRHSGFHEITPTPRFLAGIELNLSARDAEGRLWYFDVSGAFSSSRQGLRRAETLWKALGKAAVLREENATSYRLVFLSTALPLKGTPGDRILRSARGNIYHDALELLSPAGQERLSLYAAGDGYEYPVGDLLSPTEITQT